MVEPRPDPQNFLDLKFTEFTIELARQKRLVRTGRWALQIVSTVGDSEGGAKYTNPVWRSLEQLLRRQEREARSFGLESIYEKARYPMLALADQTFLVELKWAGQNDWNARCLEVEFTGRGIAGSEFFRRANELLERSDPTDDEVCKIYFYCLKMGFRGQYQKGSQVIEDLQRALRLRFQRRKPAARLCEDAYHHTERGGEGILIPSVRKTALLVAIVLVSVIVIFSVTHFTNTSELKGNLDSIEARVEILKKNLEPGKGGGRTAPADEPGGVKG